MSFLDYDTGSDADLTIQQISCCDGRFTTRPVSTGCHDGFRNDFPTERRFTMFWTFLLAMSLAAAFVKLGAASVMVSVLSMGLQASVIVIAILAALLLWKNLSKSEDQGRD